MSIEQIDHAIATAEREIARMKQQQWSSAWLGTWLALRYEGLSPRESKRFVMLCERLARLYRFRSYLFARDYTIDKIC